MKEHLIELLKGEKGAIKTKSDKEEPFTLKSGKKSRLFIDIKEASLNPIVLKEIVNLIKNTELDNFKLTYDVVGSVAVGSVPIASVLSFVYKTPQIIVRSEKHDRGTKTKVIGDTGKGNLKGKRVLLIEDVTTSGESIISAVKAIRDTGALCNECIVIVDREEGAKEECSKEGINLISILKKSNFGITEKI